MQIDLMTPNEFNNKNKNEQSVYFYGAIAKAIFSFKGNKEIPSFLKETFDIEFKEYVFRAKPLIVSRTIKIFYNDENTNFKKDYKKLVNYFYEITKKQNEVKIPKKKKKKDDANSSLEKWLKGI